MNAFQELVKVQTMDEEIIRNSFGVNKTNVMRVLKNYTLQELKEEMEKQEELLTRPKEPKKPRAKKAEMAEAKTDY